MRTIKSLALLKRGVTELRVPEGTQLMQAVALQDELVVFGMVDTAIDRMETRHLHVFFTGYSLPEEDGFSYVYLGTAMLHGFAPIHVFERTIAEPIKDS